MLRNCVLRWRAGISFYMDEEQSNAATLYVQGQREKSNGSTMWIEREREQSNSCTMWIKREREQGERNKPFGYSA